LVSFNSNGWDIWFLSTVMVGTFGFFQQ